MGGTTENIFGRNYRKKCENIATQGGQDFGKLSKFFELIFRFHCYYDAYEPSCTPMQLCCVFGKKSNFFQNVARKSKHIDSGTGKIPEVFDLRTLTGAMMVHILPSVLACSFVAFKKLKLFKKRKMLYGET